MLFVIYSHISIPIAGLFANHARDVVFIIFLNGLVIYPTLAIILFILVLRKDELHSDDKIWAFSSYLSRFLLNFLSGQYYNNFYSLIATTSRKNPFIKK
ncbi:hypothetical protein [Sutcliffiella rhizosphaerae]|uniref:Acyltransferase 3 domain-containing protein n=1 Tax=Sutcliffiella rhizosphaerae TaxID=2880967 RepID=A0ABM8YPB0_9BACI|nr:hypothetical protein [Sutcliffiella rhizosphaerae]CAG9621583.1 hypothetical protein BACCIP111883_02356 [Sutcliffiella rhizosphaerae]